VCSPQPIVALAGDDVILPCHLEPATSDFSGTVEWTREDLGPPYIHVHQSGRLVVQDPNPLYKNRTVLFVDELKNGNISLKLFRVTLSDEGRYRCFIPSIWGEAFIQLHVGESVSAASSPVLNVTKSSSGVVLECESEGWYPEPELFWLHAEGKLLSAGAPETVRGPDGLYTVSSRVTGLTISVISCRKNYKTFILPGQAQLIGPSQPIVAMLGDDVILPSHLEPAMAVVGRTVEWTRPDLNPQFVHTWREGLELLIDHHPSYKGRTSLLMAKLKDGDVSLKLSEVKLSDEGKYRCFIPSLDVHVIKKKSFVSSPFIAINKSSSGVVLECESKGWYPEPELFWLDAEGKLLSAGAPETVRGPDGLYTVSSRVTVEKSHSNSFTCRVQQSKIQQTRLMRIHLEGEHYSK
uniref:Ig-like domain-containing protein n=1 Tax=Myripristis murdjan TaxID=586833 RepID=A0A667ZEU3_9TELE